MKILLIISFILSNLGFSQVKLNLTKQAEALSKKFRKNADDDLQYNKKISDSFELKTHKERTAFFGVSQIKNIKAEEAFRFWDTNKMIEVFRTSENFSGHVIFAVQSTENEKLFFRKIFVLSEEDSEKIYNLFTEKYNHLQKLNYKSGFDGEAYIYEKKYWNRYQLNSYYTCCNDPSEAKHYLEINNHLKDFLKEKKYFEIFDQMNPFRAYRYYGTAFSVVKFKK